MNYQCVPCSSQIVSDEEHPPSWGPATLKPRDSAIRATLFFVGVALFKPQFNKSRTSLDSKDQWHGLHISHVWVVGVKDLPALLGHVDVSTCVLWIHQLFDAVEQTKQSEEQNPSNCQ